jgi:hypothetical protein
VVLEYERGHGTLGPLVRELEGLSGSFGRLHIEDDGALSRRRALVEVATREDDELERIVARVRLRDEVLQAGWREGRIEREKMGPSDTGLHEAA